MEDITVEELKKRMDSREKLNVIDVREVWEFDEFNIGAKLIPLHELPAKLVELAAWKDKEVIVHCKAGGRSANAKMYLQQQGFTQVRNLVGGMDEWKRKYV